MLGLDPTYTTVRRLTPSLFFLLFPSCVVSELAYATPLRFIAAIPEIESDLHASSSEISLSLAVFILIQGGIPIAWSALSEIKGRKVCALRVPYPFPFLQLFSR